MSPLSKGETFEPIDYVNPNIGGMAHLLKPTLPLIHLPNSMMRISKQPQGYDQEKITHFPINIVSHRMAAVGRIMVTKEEINTNFDSWSSEYDHDFEVVKPYYYSVLLENPDIDVDLTSTEHTAFYLFKYNSGNELNLYIQTLNTGQIELSPDRKTIEGFEIVSGVKVYFYMVLKGLIEKFGTFQPGLRHNNQKRIEGDQAGVYLTIAAQKNYPVKLKVGISYISVEQAAKHLDKELPDWDFELVTQKNRAVWNQALSKIKVEGGSDDKKKVFYTALYRCLERMVNISEDGQYFSSYDDAVHDDGGISFYVDDWAWDTYRAQHPLQILINPQEQIKKITSYIRMYEQSGSIPLFPTLPGDLGCMNGNHPSAIITDAYIKGLRGFDIGKAYEGLKKRALESTMLPWCNGPLTELDEFYHKNGFFPSLKPGQQEHVKEVDELEKRQAVSVTLGHSYDDWCLAILARELGKKDDYEFFLGKSQNYKNLFNPQNEFFAPRSEDGEWVKPFDPIISGGFGGRDYFTENNAWTYLFDVQHDVQGLIQLVGGREQFIAKLDALFTEKCGTRRSTYFAQFPDATGLVGQFAMGNEPSLHIPYLYNYAGVPWKTQKRIRMLMDLWFTNSPFGMCGDEDGGGLSSFYVFSAMGFYPVTPGSPLYNIGSPLFSKTEIDLGNDKIFKIEAKNCSARNKYIQSAKLNGKKLDRPFFSHSDIIDGGILILTMGPRPNFEWGKNT